MAEQLLEQKQEKHIDELRMPPTEPGRNGAQENEAPEPGGKPVLGTDGFYGLPGKIAQTIDPYTEADPVAVLVTNLVYFGNIMDRGPYFMVEATPHFTNLNAVFAGRTSKSRKGTSRSTTDHIYEEIDSTWVDNCSATGLASGEGLIHRVRDPQLGDLGVTDKRLMVIEEEFSRPLKVMGRDTNILSDIIRNAFDGKPLSNLTRNSPEKATNAHISIIGHITEEELLRYLTQTDMANGFANRFLWFHVDRSKLIPNPEGVPPSVLDPLVIDLKAAVSFARPVEQMKRDARAEALWAEVYPHLSEGKPGLVGAITSRAEAQVLRLSMIYALMDCSGDIRVEHLKGALALWNYCQKSVEMIFEDQIGDRSVDFVAKVLKATGRLSRTQIYRLLGRNVDQKEVDRIIRVLCNTGKAELKTEQGTQVLYPKN